MRIGIALAVAHRKKPMVVESAGKVPIGDA
jgi:hypothetical protein